MASIAQRVRAALETWKREGLESGCSADPSKCRVMFSSLCLVAEEALEEEKEDVVKVHPSSHSRESCARAHAFSHRTVYSVGFWPYVSFLCPYPRLTAAWLPSSEGAGGRVTGGPPRHNHIHTAGPSAPPNVFPRLPGKYHLGPWREGGEHERQRRHPAAHSEATCHGSTAAYIPAAGSLPPRGSCHSIRGPRTHHPLFSCRIHLGGSGSWRSVPIPAPLPTGRPTTTPSFRHGMPPRCRRPPTTPPH